MADHDLWQIDRVTADPSPYVAGAIIKIDPALGFPQKFSGMADLRGGSLEHAAGTPAMPERKPVVKTDRCGNMFLILPGEEVVMRVEWVIAKYQPPPPDRHEPR